MGSNSTTKSVQAPLVTYFGTVDGAPMDWNWLSSWVEVSHARPEEVAAYRRDFAAHPARLIVIPSFLRAGIADRVAQFLEREAEFRPVHVLSSRPTGEEAVTAEEWAAADAQDRFFRFSEPSGVGQEFRLSPNVVAYLEIVRALGDARFVRFAEGISGLALGSSRVNVHSMAVGDFLSPHSDARDHRRLTFVLFLSRGWDPGCGGTLHLADGGGGHWSIEPAFNTLVIFDIHAHEEHWVTPIEPAAGTRTRVTIGGWIADRPAP
jgi:hypothetical protein